MKTLLVFTSLVVLTLSVISHETTDGELSRKILGSSVVTSVSVIMDNGNGSKTVYTDAVGKPIGKPANGAELASPINLLNPDRYEFYTFDDNGDLVKRLMSLDEIKGIIATGDSDGLDFDSFTSQGYLPERRVNEVVNTVQNVLKGEMETHKNTLDVNLTLDTPDVSNSWSMILPAVFGNSGEDIKPEKPIIHVTPDTIMLEPNSSEISSQKTTLITKMSPPTITTSEMPTFHSKTPLSDQVTNDVLTTSQPDLTSSQRPVSPQSSIDDDKITLNSQISSYSSVSSSSITPTLKTSSASSEAVTSPTPSKSSVPTSTFIINTQNYKEPSTLQITGTETTTSMPSFIQTETTSGKQPFSTWIPSFTNLNHYNSDITSTNSEGLTTFYAVSDDKRKATEKQTSEEIKIQPTTEKSSNEDLNTMSTEYIGYQGGVQNNFKETIPLEQAMSDAEKISASALLDQLLLTTNVYEINTELSQNELYKLNTDQRFDMSTQRLPEFPENEYLTTEKFLIKVSDQTLGHNNLIQSIDQLLSQAVNNVEELLTNVNNTDKIQDLLNNSFNKTMDQSQKEAATVASNMVDETFSKASEQTTLTQSNVDDIKESLESQIYKLSTQDNASVDESKETVASSIFNNESENISRTESYILNDPFETTQMTTAGNYLQYETNWNLSNISKTEEENVQKNQSNIPFKTNDIEVENMPPLINITIITPENTKYKIKPLPTSTISNKIFYKSENTNKNNSDTESTEIYIESMFDVSKPINVSMIAPNTTKIMQELLDSQYNMESTTSIENTDESQKDITKTESSYTTQTNIGTSFISADKLSTFSLNDDKPTTIIIIKRTERPPQQDTTTVIPETTQVTTSTDTTTNFISTIDMEESKNKEPLIDLISFFTTTEKDAQQITQGTETNSPSKPAYQIYITEGNKDNNSIHRDESENCTLETTDKLTTVEEQSTISNENKKHNNESTEYFSNQKIQNDFHNDTSFESNPKQPESTWTLVPTIAPHAEQALQNSPPPLQHFSEIIEPPSPIDLDPNPMQGSGLEESTATLDNDLNQFARLCNELAFEFWKTVTNGISSARSVFISPFGVTSFLAMVFLGARGATSGEMNEILKLDDMVTFNPHLTFKSISESIKVDSDSGVATSAIIRELFSDRSKGKLLPFYKERAKAFYDGFVEEAGFREISDTIRRRTNLHVKKSTGGRISEFWKDSLIKLRPPLAGLSVNLFQTDCSHASTSGRDGELHFIVLPTIRQRRLVPVPAVVYRSGFLAGYEPSLDATAVSFGTKDKTVSTILVMPGQQGMTAPGDGLARLEKRLVESSFKKGAWSRLLRTLIPRPNMEVQIPRFSHRSFINATAALKKMGLHDLFDADKADLRGLNGVPNELFLSDIIQVNNFATCGEKPIGETHHSEIYPASGSSSRNARNLLRYEGDFHKVFHDPLHDPTDFDLPLPLRPRQARIPEVPRLKFDKPFLYYVRHNPTGLILHMGRFNPRLLP